MKKIASASQRAVINTRKKLRYDTERLALTHRGCEMARGCGCLVDIALSIMQKAEADLFAAEIDSYANPSTARRIVQANNEVLLD